MYFHTARVPSPSGWKRHPAPKRAKNHGPVTIVIPTEVGGRQETYSLTIAGEIGPAKEGRVYVRTPTPGSWAPSRKCCSRMKGSHRCRTGPCVWDTAKARSGGMGTCTSAVTCGMSPP